MSFLNKALVLLLVVGLVTKTSSTFIVPFPYPQVCVFVPANLQACAGVLSSGQLTVPVPLGCCAALNLIKLSTSVFGIRTTCLCAKLSITGLPTPPPPPPTTPSPPPPTPIPVDISTQLQTACGVNVGFNISIPATCP